MLVIKNPPASSGDTREVGLIPGSGGSLEDEMATHSRVLAWEIPWTEEPGGLQSMQSWRVGYDLATEQQQQHLLFHQNHGSKNLGCTRNELVVTDRLREQVWKVGHKEQNVKLNVAGTQQGQVSTSPPFKNITANTTGSKQVEKGKLKRQRERKWGCSVGPWTWNKVTRWFPSFQ